jgi:hypothetical protein
LVLTYNAKVWILTERSKNKSIIQALYKKFLRSTEEKIRRNRIRNESFRDVGIQKFVTRVRRESITMVLSREKMDRTTI